MKSTAKVSTRFMTKGELLELLKEYPDDREVAILSTVTEDKSVGDIREVSETTSIRLFEPMRTITGSY